MSDYNFVIMFGLLVIGIVAGVAISQFIRIRWPGSEDTIGEALLLVALALRATFDDAEVKAVAGWVYDHTIVGQYYDRAAWIAMALRVFEMIPQETAEAATRALPE